MAMRSDYRRDEESERFTVIDCGLLLFNGYSDKVLFDLIN